MQALTILHSNDIHGRIEGLARIATLVERIRAEQPDAPVLYVDGGDIEETARYISNVTSGVAMHRLLSVAGCEAAAVGNGGFIRYGSPILRKYAEAASYPLLLANIQTAEGEPLPGTAPALLMEVESLRIGFIGLTANIFNIYEEFFGLRAMPEAPLTRELAAQLREQGANIIILLSHLGLDEDRKLAQEVQDDIDIIIGSHSHHVLSEGERVGDVLIAQAGEFAEYLGRLDMTWDEGRLNIERVSAIPITDDIVPSPRVMDELRTVEREVVPFLNEIVGELAQPLDYTTDRECGTANLVADMLRERMNANIGVVVASVGILKSLPAGQLTRKTLWDACPSPANPGVVNMTGAQLTALMRKGLDAEFARDMPRAMRGDERGLMHISGAVIRDGRILFNSQPIEPERVYRVAATDWELGVAESGDYADPAWQLRPTYDIPVIIREALEEYLQLHRPVRVTMGRLGPLNK